MKQSLALAAILSVLFTGCDSSNSDDSSETTPNSVFESKYFNNGEDEVLIDLEQNLTWINDVDGCLAGEANVESVHCSETLNAAAFAESTAWRMPTKEELSTLYKNIAKEGKKLNYINPHCAYATASDGHVQTENTTEPGKITAFVPSNSGVRCVFENK